MNIKQYRQGDIYFQRLEDSIPGGAAHQEDGVIARGEVTGHMHRISDGAKAMLMIAAGVAYVKAMQEADIVHEEHATVTLPIGEYQVVRQREYIPDGWVQVAD